MRVLALDTTTRGGSVAIAEDGRVVFERMGDGARSHAERLPAELIDALHTVGWSMSDIDLFAVASGPGSFTGLRIGIATMQGLAFVHGKRVAAVSALRALAEAAATGAPPGTRVGAWMDASRREVFSALYDVASRPHDDSVTLTDVEAPTASPPASTIERWSQLGLPSSLCGEGAMKYAPLVPTSIRVLPSPALAPIVARLALMQHAAGDTRTPAGVQPLYVRRPDVEIVREATREARLRPSSMWPNGSPR
ncbi:MAG: tRNA (adenosine(37)-N6)-threonylcarbamoyltransferase complex dimerization subunit type 1 TsaB [Vicinamibacterales bacterium]